MTFHLQREFIEALTDHQKTELFSNVCGYLEDSGHYLDHFNSEARWSRETILDYINNQFWEDFSDAATADIKSGGDKERLFQFIVLPQCRHLLPEQADKPYMEETGQVTRHTGHLVTCLVVPNFWSIDKHPDQTCILYLEVVRNVTVTEIGQCVCPTHYSRCRIWERYVGTLDRIDEFN